MNLKLRTSVKLHKAVHVFTSWALYQRDNRGQICASDDSQCFLMLLMLPVSGEVSPAIKQNKKNPTSELFRRHVIPGS